LPSGSSAAATWSPTAPNRETIRLVRDWGISVVQGNCEESLGLGAADCGCGCGCGFAAGTACSLLAVDWYRYATERIADEDRAWMRSLPKSLCFELNRRSVRVVHGGLAQINRFIFPSTPNEVKQKELDQSGTDILVGGHSGIPCAQRLGGRA
jgi:predicted phosphodiesterase